MLNKITFWELLTNYKIDIALIERDYAFGHKRVAFQREHFLNKIERHLSDNYELHLDYVYGRVEGDTFTPIDGKKTCHPVSITLVYNGERRCWLRRKRNAQ